MFDHSSQYFRVGQKFSAVQISGVQFFLSHYVVIARKKKISFLIWISDSVFDQATKITDMNIERACHD